MTPSLTARPRAALRLTRGGHSAPRTGYPTTTTEQQPTTKSA